MADATKGSSASTAKTVSVAGVTYDLSGLDTFVVGVQPEGTLSNVEAAAMKAKLLAHIANENGVTFDAPTKSSVFLALLLDHALVGTSDKRNFDNTITVGNKTYRLTGLKKVYNGMCRRFARTHYDLVLELLSVPGNLDSLAEQILNAKGMNMTQRASIGACFDFAPASKMVTKPDLTKQLIDREANIAPDVDPYSAFRASIDGGPARSFPGMVPQTPAGLGHIPNK